MATRAKLGAVVAQEGGYSVRQSGETKIIKAQGREKKVFHHSGTYAIHAGRKKIIKDGFKQTTDAVTHIKENL